MRTEAPQAEVLKDSDILVIGSGPVGEKARQLIQKTPTLRRLGLRTPPRTVLAQGFFDDYFQSHGLGPNLVETQPGQATEELVKQHPLTEEQLRVLEGITRSFGKTPVVVRSSAEGDARGTGTYRSAFSPNEPTQIAHAVQDVLSSYFSEAAIAFRRDAQTGEGMGVIIEPLIGQRMNGALAPVLSGFGYTSTSRGDGYITAVPGLGGSVNGRSGERITRAALEETEGNLDEYLYAEFQAMSFGHKTMRRSALLRNQHAGWFDSSYDGLVYSPSRSSRQDLVIPQSLDFSGEIKDAFSELNLFPFFDQLSQMEHIFGKAQYLEWAMTVQKGHPHFWVLQIADVDKKLDMIDFGNFGKPLFSAHTVTGTGVRDCHNIAMCWNPPDVHGLYRYNQQNGNYVLVYSSRLCSGGGLRNALTYDAFSNATVFVEIQDATHSGDPLSHLGGQLDMTNKFFGVLDYRDEVAPDFETFDAKQQTVNGIRVLQSGVKAISSERQNQMIVCLNEGNDITS